MGRIYIDTAELREIARDLRSYGGRITPIKQPLARGMNSTILAPPWGTRAWISHGRLTYELDLLGGKLWADATTLEIEALTIDAREGAASLWRTWYPRLKRWGSTAVAIAIVVSEIPEMLRDIAWERLPFVGDNHRFDVGDPVLRPDPLVIDSSSDYLRLIETLKPGEIAIVEVSPNRWVVVLPGIKSLVGANSKQDLPDAVEAAMYGDSAYAEGVRTAMQIAGVPGGAEVMFVGHSQGGITAVNLAADPVMQQRYAVKAVVAAGSPVTADLNNVPKETRAISLVNSRDIVPNLDPFAKSTDSKGGNHSEVVFEGSTFQHGLESYAHKWQTLSAESGGDGPVSAFESATSQFHSGTARVQVLTISDVGKAPKGSGGW